MKSLTKQLDTLWSRKIRSRDLVCARCGKSGSTQAAHIFSRSNRMLRWDMRNGIGLCYYCHIYWAHRNPVEFVEWVRERMGDGAFTNLKVLSAERKSWLLEDLRAKVEELTNQ